MAVDVGCCNVGLCGYYEGAFWSTQADDDYRG